MRVSRSRGPFEQDVYIQEEVKIESVRRVKRKLEKYPIPFLTTIYHFTDLYEIKIDTGEKVIGKVSYGGTKYENKGKEAGKKAETLLKKLEDKEVKITGTSGYNKEEIYPTEIEINGNKKLSFENSPKIPDRYFLVHDLSEDLESQSNFP